MSVISYIIAFVVIAQIFGRIKRKQQPRSPQPKPQSKLQSTVRQQPQQSAYDWMFGDRNAKAPDAEAAEGAEDDDWITPVQTTVVDEITMLGESRHETVRESVHETVHVRQRRHDAPAPAPAPEAPLLRFDKQALAQALLLGDVLGEPRAKRPWKPKRSN